MDGKEILDASLEWLRSVFGSEIEMPWSRTRELVLGDDADLWDEIFEEAFTSRMKAIIELGFDELSRVVNVKGSVHAIMFNSGEQVNFQDYVNRPHSGGGVWFVEQTGQKIGPLASSKVTHDETNFESCIDAYFGDEVGQIRKTVDTHCKNVLEDVLSFLESPKASIRLKELASCLQNECFGSVSAILAELNNEVEDLYATLGHGGRSGGSSPPPVIITQRSLFIGKVLFAFQKYSRHIMVILESPRLWLNEIVAAESGKMGKKVLDMPRWHSPLAASALFGVDDTSSPQLEELRKTTQDLCIRAHKLWIIWVSDELSAILSHHLRNDDCLSATTPLRGWEQTVVKQDDSVETQSEIKISLPFMPSLYINSYLFQACEEIHQVGGHVLDKPILQSFAARLLEKVIDVYLDFLSIEEGKATRVSEKGVLQVLLDLRFTADILAGGDVSENVDMPKPTKTKMAFRRKPDMQETKSVIKDRLDGLVNRLSQRLDPIDWLTYEPYLWENEKQSYLRHAVLFGFFVHLRRMYTATVQKLPTTSESNIMRCSTVPRFKYLPISVPVLSTKGTSKASAPSSMEDVSSRNSWRNYTQEALSRNLDMDGDSSFGVATPFLKSFMQVGSKFGESLKLGSMLTDGQMGRFGDILPAQAAGLLSSFTTARSDN